MSNSAALLGLIIVCLSLFLTVTGLVILTVIDRRKPRVARLIVAVMGVPPAALLLYGIVFDNLIGFTVDEYKAFCFRDEIVHELVDYDGRIDLGMSSQEIIDVFVAGNYRYLRMTLYLPQDHVKNIIVDSKRVDVQPSRSRNAAIVTGPGGMGASEWYVYVELNEDLVVSVRIRTGEDKDYHPDGAPPDKVNAQRSRWEGRNFL